MSKMSTLEEVNLLSSISKRANEDEIREYCSIANKKDKRHFTLSDAHAYLKVTKKTINTYCSKLGIDPARYRDEGAQWLIDIDDIYQIREAMHEEPKNKLKFPKFVRSPIQTALTICFASKKGGATKTTSAIHLASGLALRHEQYRILLIDTDDTMAASIYYCPPNPDVEDGFSGSDDFTFSDLLLGEYKDDIPEGMSEGQFLAEKMIYDTTIPNLKIIPARGKDASLTKMLEERIASDGNMNPFSILKEKLDLLSDYFDVIIIDTQPTIDYRVYNALYAANMLFIPMGATGNDFRVTKRWFESMPTVFENLVEHGFEGYDRKIQILVGQSDGSTSSTEIEGELMRLYPNNTMPVRIMHSEAVLRCSQHMMTVFDLSRSEYQYSYKKGFDETINNFNGFINQIKFEMDQVWNEQLRG